MTNTKFYFSLQFKRVQRRLDEIGFGYILGVLFFTIAFILFSTLLFHKISNAVYIYIVIGVVLLLRFRDNGHKHTLTTVFNKRERISIAALENVIVILPFIGYLLYELRFIEAAILLGIGIFLPLLPFQNLINLTIPTPFRRFPFEYIAGFRKLILCIGILYFVGLKGIQVGNFNLALFALASLFAVCLSFYESTEEEYFVWIYSQDSLWFLRGKIITSLFCSSILTFPLFALLLYIFGDSIVFIIVVQIFGYLLLLLTILIKYSVFPQKPSLYQALLFLLFIFFPPTILLVGPIVYNKARKRLNAILGW